MRIKALTSLLLLGFLSLAQLAWAGPKIESWTTANGARVLFVAAPDLPMVDVRVVFDAGSTRDGKTPGLASLVNATLTDGAGDWDADQLAERLESVGAQLGSGSLRDMAWVSIRSLTEKKPLEVAVSSLQAILGKPRFSSQDLERNRQAMLVSLRHAQQNPGTVAKKAFWKAVFGDHPYASDPDGTEASLREITADQVKDFYRTYYVAGNATVALVGDLDLPAARALSERLLGDLPRGKLPPALPATAALPESVEERVAFPSSQSHILIGQPGMRRGDPDYFPLYVGNHILGGSGLVSRLTNEVREKRGLSYSVYSYFSPMRVDGPFILGAQTQNAKAGEALSVARETLARFVEQGPTPEELTAAKQNITGGFPMKVASNSKIVEYLGMIGYYGLPLDYLDRFVERIDSVTLEQIRDAFKRRLDTGRMATIVVGNGKRS